MFTRFATFLRSPKFHLVMTIVWAILIPPTILWWRHSILWVALLSIYANMATHWGAYQGARAEEAVKEQ